MNQQDFETTCNDLGIDPDDIRSKAVQQATREMTDKALYGFSARDADGNRIDPINLLPEPHKRTASAYDALVKAQRADIPNLLRERAQPQLITPRTGR